MGKDVIKCFYDTETTGTKPYRHSIHQLSGGIEINDEIVEEFNFKTRPNPKALLDPEALKVGGVTKEIVLAYKEMKVQQRAFRKLLRKYVSPYDKLDKMWLIGFNNRGFDDLFLFEWFRQCNDEFFFAYFWGDTIDVLPLASEFLINRRRSMVNFKLKTVAAELGIDVQDDKLHDASYDWKLAREIYQIVTFRDLI